MRGPLAELFRATEAAQRGEEGRARTSSRQRPPAELPAAEPDRRREAALEATVEHVYEFDEPEAAEEPAQQALEAPAEAPKPEPPVTRARPSLCSKPCRSRRCQLRPEPAPSPPRPYEPPASRFLHVLPEGGPRPERRSGARLPYLAVIRVVGVGGAGLNAVNRMVDAGIAQVDYVAVNTDAQQLTLTDAGTKIHIGEEITHGLGSGADPETGRLAAEHAYDQIRAALRGSDMVFVTAGEGGGTGTGAAPVVARVARELGALTVGIVTTPFKFEGTRRRQAAEGGAEALRSRVRHGDRDPERPAARGARPVDLDGRGVQDRGRHPPTGGPGHLRT